MTAAPVAVMVPRDVVRASGPDARSFLQGQCTQDVSTLAVGASRWAMVLDPTGKLVVVVRITCVGDEEFLCDLDSGFAAALVARLERFKLRTRCDLAAESGWSMLALRGPGAADVPVPTGVLRIDAAWPSGDAVDLLGVDPAVPSGVQLAEVAALDRLRVAQGVPAMGTELGPETIPAEGGSWLMRVAVSFTKGCYTGQELVARVDSRGSNTPFRLRRLRAVDATFGTVAVGIPLTVEGRDVGRLGTTVPGDGTALAMVHRSVEPGAVVRAGAGDGLAAVVEDLDPVPAEG